MKERLSTAVGRRDLLRVVMTGAAAAVTANTAAQPAAAAEPETGVTGTDKRRARYQPNSAEVQEFYRVNRYPNRR